MTAILPAVVDALLPQKICVFLAEPRTKKADVAECPKAFGHVGLLFNEPPGGAGLFLI
jgi:hypothetical protein